MSMSLRQKIDAINVRIQSLHADTQLALRGERDFGVEQVLALSASIQEMAPIIAHTTELRAVEPELATRLESYKSQLRELQTTLDQIRLMLLTKRNQMLTRDGQLEAVSKWAGALQQTQ
jgi:tetrahydromethanopterin S-methyltransferase subunit F